jgi:integrase
VFTFEDGRPHHPDTIRQRFDRLAAAAGLSRITFHDLRHSYATGALKAGVSAKVVSVESGTSGATACMRAGCSRWRGARRSEVLGLAWSAVDFNAGTVTVAQGRVVVLGGGTTTGAPKSERSRRTLPMPAEVMAALRSLRTQQSAERLAFGESYPDTGLVAVAVDGTPFRPETYSKAFARHCTAARVPPIRLHDTRHTAATRMLDSGTTVSAAAKWLGHDPAMTLRVYGHVLLGGAPSTSSTKS